MYPPSRRKTIKRVLCDKQRLTTYPTTFSALVANRDEDMRAAFDLFAGADGAIDTEEMKTVVPLIGEEMDEEQVRCLFKMADKDASGLIDFPEFCMMMYALTPKSKSLLDSTAALVQAQEALEKGLAAVDADPNSESAVNELGAAYAMLIASELNMALLTEDQNPEPMTPKKVMEASMKAAAKVGQSFEALKTLDPLLQARIFRPQDHTRAGRVIQRMNEYAKKSFTQEDINNVIMSMVADSDAEMDAAFALWAGEDGKIDTAEFIEVVPLLGEDLTEEEITVMFKHADKDGGGHIDVDEFKALMYQMQMKGDGSERHKIVGAARAQAYADTKK